MSKVLFSHKLQSMDINGNIVDSPIKITVDNSYEEAVISEISFLEPTIGHLLSSEDSIIGIYKKIKESEDSITTKQSIIESQNDGELVLNKVILETVNRITLNDYKLESCFEKSIKRLFTSSFQMPNQPNKSTLIKNSNSGVYLQSRDYDLLSFYDHECIKKKLKLYCETLLSKIL